jgi:hypothetical protein
VILADCPQRGEYTVSVHSADPLPRAIPIVLTPRRESARLWLHVMETVAVAAFCEHLPGRLTAAGVGRPERFAAMSIRQSFSGPPAGSVTISASRTLLEAMEPAECESSLHRVIQHICECQLARFGASADHLGMAEPEQIPARLVGDDPGRTSSVVVRSTAGWIEVSLGFDATVE